MKASQNREAGRKSPAGAELRASYECVDCKRTLTYIDFTSNGRGGRRPRCRYCEKRKRQEATTCRTRMMIITGQQTGPEIPDGAELTELQRRKIGKKMGTHPIPDAIADGADSMGLTVNKEKTLVSIDLIWDPESNRLVLNSTEFSDNVDWVAPDSVIENLNRYLFRAD